MQEHKPYFPALPGSLEVAPSTSHTTGSEMPQHLADIVRQSLRSKDAVMMSRSQIRWQQFGHVWQCLACFGSGALLGATGYHVLYPPVPPQIVSEPKPVIVQQKEQVVVDRGCIAFCGK